MCGIAGAWKSGGLAEADVAAVRSMVSCIRHRGPDDDGFFDDGRLSMGMRRLSIIDVEAGTQPQFNESETLALVFNGEIYNHVELRAGLLDRGHTFRSHHSDAEVILHLYEEEGIEALRHLNGMFGFCLWDRQRGVGFLVRDRLGIKPMYYQQAVGRLLFGSEMKSLWRVNGERSLDPDGMLSYLTYGYIPAPHSALAGVRKVMPGHYLQFGADGLREVRYWAPLNPGSEITDLGAGREEFLRLVEDATMLELRSDVPVGIFLSGGIDSSLVAAMVGKIRGPGMDAFTISYYGERHTEVHAAAEVARLHGFRHHVIEASRSHLEALPRMLWHLDEPHHDSAMLGNFLVAELASKFVKVVLSGIGGDELFAGYPRHVRPLTKRLAHLLPGFLEPGFEALAARAPAGRRLFQRIVNNWTPDRSFLWAQRMFPPGRLRGFFADRVTDDSGESAELLRYFGELRSDRVNRMLWADAQFYLIDDPLALFDRLGMAWSIEGRVPLLDHRLVEFAYRLPGRLKVPRQQMKGLLRSWLRGVLPDAILDRPKTGFGAPVMHWIETGLNSVLLAAIDTRPASRDTLFWGARGHDLRALWSGLSGQQRFLLGNLELWCRIFMDGEPYDQPLSELVQGHTAGRIAS